MTPAETLSKVMHLVWWISLVWLAVAFVGEVWWFVKFVSEPHNPARIEYGIGAGYVFLYSWPAALGMIAAATAPRTGLSTAKRLIGAGLLFCYITILFLFK